MNNSNCSNSSIRQQQQALGTSAQLHSNSLQCESNSGSNSTRSAHLCSRLQQLQNSSIASMGTDNTYHNTIKREACMTKSLEVLTGCCALP